MRKGFVISYFLLLSIHIIAGEMYLQLVANITKPLLLLTLLAYFIVQTSSLISNNKFALFVLLGLILSLLGDILLMFQYADDLYFILGLSSFLLAHVSYSIAFVKTNLDNHEIPLIKQQGWVMVLIVAYGFVFFTQLKDHLGEMIAPVMLYTAVITLMLLLAANRYKKVSRQSFQFVLFGAMLFVASDSILAWNKFVKSLPYAHSMVMGTYGMAQLLIILGSLKQMKDQTGYRKSL